MCALGFYDDKLWHTIEVTPPPGVSWQPYNDVKPVLTNSPWKIDTIGLAGVGSNLHLCAISGGSILHTIRMSVPPSWQNPENSGNAVWGDVSAVVSGITNGTPNFVDCANADENLHVCCITTTGALFHTIRLSATPRAWRNPEISGTAVWRDAGAVVGALGVNPAPFSLLTTAGA
jgi:hypothetical protein